METLAAANSSEDLPTSSASALGTAKASSMHFDNFNSGFFGIIRSLSKPIPINLKVSKFTLEPGSIPYNVYKLQDLHHQELFPKLQLESQVPRQLLSSFQYQQLSPSEKKNQEKNSLRR
jgi:hypothetical protein